HAIVPNVNVMDDLEVRITRLSDDEKRLFALICRSYLAAVMPDFEYRQTVVTMKVPVPRQEAGAETDDGYLSASEIAALKLDADWVILSACNTAAGGAPGSEALSGLARAFFYAGARSLLVSHWAVDSASTVKLITKALGNMSADKSVGRAEAMR